MKNSIIVLLSSFLLLGTSCAEKKSTARGIGPGGDPLPITTAPSYNKMGECTRSVTNGLSLVAQISTHYNAYGTMDQDIVQLNFSQIPAELKTSDTHFMKIYRWKESSTGQSQVNSIPTPIYFKNKVSGSLLSQQPVDQISKTALQSQINNGGLASQGVTPSNFFNYFYVLLGSVDFQWQAVTFAFYDSSAGSEAITSADSLLPPYYASPAVYAFKTPSPRLQALHPLNSLKNSGASEAEYKSLCDNICYDFFGTIRSPASAQEPSFGQKIFGWFSSLYASVRSFLSDFLSL